MLMSRLFSLAHKNLVLVFVFVLVSLVRTGLTEGVRSIEGYPKIKNWNFENDLSLKRDFASLKYLK